MKHTITQGGYTVEIDPDLHAQDGLVVIRTIKHTTKGEIRDAVAIPRVLLVDVALVLEDEALHGVREQNT